MGTVRNHAVHADPCTMVICHNLIGSYHVWSMLFTDTCDTSALKLGYDMCLCPVGKLCRMRRSRQHLLDLQSEDSWRQCPSESRAVGPQWIFVMLPLPGWQPDCHQLWRYDLVCCQCLPLCRYWYRWQIGLPLELPAMLQNKGPDVAAALTQQEA